MIKLGIYGSYFGKDDPKTLPYVEDVIDFAYELKLDVVDFRADVGFRSQDTDYLRAIKIKCLKAGLPIGYLATGGHFVGTEDELEQKMIRCKADLDTAVFLGTPMVRSFCGPTPETDEGKAREIECFQELCDAAAEKGIIVGVQNHPCTGDGVLHLLRETNRENIYLYSGYRSVGGFPFTDPRRSRSGHRYLRIYGADRSLCRVCPRQNL